MISESHTFDQHFENLCIENEGFKPNFLEAMKMYKHKNCHNLQARQIIGKNLNTLWEEDKYKMVIIVILVVFWLYIRPVSDYYENILETRF